MRTQRTTREMLEEISYRQVESGSFPTYIDLILRIKSVLVDPEADLKEVNALLVSEPILATRVIKAANSASDNRGQRISTIEAAVARLGLIRVRRLGLSVALEQLSKSKAMLPVASVSRGLWLTSFYRSVAADVFTNAYTSRSNDEVAMRGLLSTIGAFYLLHKYCERPRLLENLDEIVDALHRHADRVTGEILIKEGLGRPIEIPSSLEEAQAKLFDEDTILYFSIILSDQYAPWHEKGLPGFELPEPYEQLVTVVNRKYQEALALHA